MLPADDKVEELTEALARRDLQLQELREKLSAATGGDSGGSSSDLLARLKAQQEKTESLMEILRSKDDEVTKVLA